jgi:hypothetical protein
MKSNLYIVLIGILPAFIGCGPPTLDVTDAKTYEESLSRVSAELSAEERDKLKAALQMLLEAKARQASALDVEAEPYLLANEFRGWTAQQIIAQAEVLRTQDELRKKQREAASAKKDPPIDISTDSSR